MTDLQALAAFVYELHKHVALLLNGADIGELSDAWYRPRERLGNYFDVIDELRVRFGVPDEAPLTKARATGLSPWEDARLAKERAGKDPPP